MKYKESHSPGKYARTIALNVQYMILFRNFRDGSQVDYLGRQLFPGEGKRLLEAYNDATSEKNGYILIDLSPSHFDDALRLRTNFLPNEYSIVYIPRYNNRTGYK